jgi:hypothetical protein
VGESAYRYDFDEVVRTITDDDGERGNFSFVSRPEIDVLTRFSGEFERARLATSLPMPLLTLTSSFTRIAASQFDAFD